MADVTFHEETVGMSNDYEFKNKQKIHYENIYRRNSPREVQCTPAQTFFEWCKHYPLELLNGFFSCIGGSSVLVTCAGDGYELRVLSAQGLRVTATDLTVGPLERLKEHGVIQEFSAQDAESLTYDSDTFDYGFVSNGLHHLRRPHMGLHELLRCSKRGVVFIESQDSMLLNIRRIFGVRAKDFEPAGNYVYRWKRREIEKICLSLHAHSFAANTFFLKGITRMRKMGGFKLAIAKRAYAVANLFLSRVGNGMVVIIFKEAPTDQEVAALHNASFDYHVCRYL